MAHILSITQHSDRFAGDPSPRTPNAPEPRTFSVSARTDALIFEDPASQQLLKHLERIAPSDATVLITGETGTGKELVARHIHALSARRNGPFGALNCAALTESLIESELFGHEKGAFTGAVATKNGWFETAHKGTLFLNEVGDLPLGLQAKLLRVLQEREVVKVGARCPTPVDVRVIVDTNVNLEDAVKAGRFRADLYYRLNVAVVQLLPLRKRPGDVLPLAHHFLKLYGDRLGRRAVRLSGAAKRILLNYDWPGNIRELENTIHRALLTSSGDTLRPDDFKLSGLRPQSMSLIPTLEGALHALYEKAPPKLFDLLEETIIRTAFEFCGENQVQASQLLDISRNILRHRMTLYDMLPERQPRGRRNSGASAEVDEESHRTFRSGLR